jgi:hypothetical protein
MRVVARLIKRDALITCNNSLNSADALFSQSRTMGYNIYEFSKAEDLVLVEDMSSQPRVLANGNILEYGATYRQLHAIDHGKPVVAVTIADGDYHTPPNLVRLAMAEAVAHNASYLWWPTWPEKERPRMVATIRPQAEFFRRNETLLNSASVRRDVLVFLPFRRWLETDKCGTADLAAALTRANIQYEVLCEDDFAFAVEKETSRVVVPAPKTTIIPKKEIEPKLKRIRKSSILPVLLLESMDLLTPKERAVVEKFKLVHGHVINASEPNWLKQLQSVVNPSVMIDGPATIRAVVHDQPMQTIVHLYNLNVERLSSFQDKIHPAEKIGLKIRVPLKRVQSVKLLIDTEKSPISLHFQSRDEGNGTVIETTVPKLEISALLLIES